jgi:hypothetical protein
MTEQKTVRIQDRSGDTTHWEACYHDVCQYNGCPRYDRCCGEVVV